MPVASVRGSRQQRDPGGGDHSAGDHEREQPKAKLSHVPLLTWKTGLHCPYPTGRSSKRRPPRLLVAGGHGGGPRRRLRAPQPRPGLPGLDRQRHRLARGGEGLRQLLLVLAARLPPAAGSERPDQPRGADAQVFSITTPSGGHLGCLDLYFKTPQPGARVPVSQATACPPGRPGWTTAGLVFLLLVVLALPFTVWLHRR